MWEKKKKKKHQSPEAPKQLSCTMDPADMVTFLRNGSNRHGLLLTVNNYMLLYMITISQFSPAGRLSGEHNPTLQSKRPTVLNSCLSKKEREREEEPKGKGYRGLRKHVSYT